MLLIPIIPWVWTAPPPSHHSCQEVSGDVERGQWAAVDSTKTLLVPFQISGAQHAVGEIELVSVGVLGTAAPAQPTLWSAGTLESRHGSG